MKTLLNHILTLILAIAIVGGMFAFIYTASNTPIPQAKPAQSTFSHDMASLCNQLDPAIGQCN
jgi:Na+-translocating ferredoxin:NAD+ oxidoreductase RnfG subunit